MAVRHDFYSPERHKCIIWEYYEFHHYSYKYNWTDTIEETEFVRENGYEPYITGRKCVKWKIK